MYNLFETIDAFRFAAYERIYLIVCVHCR